MLDGLLVDGLGPFERERDLIALHEDLLLLKDVQKSIDRIGHNQVRRQIEDWLKQLGAVVHDRCTTKGKGLFERPTERLWSLRDHDRYARMSAIERADAYLAQKFGKDD